MPKLKIYRDSSSFGNRKTRFSGNKAGLVLQTEKTNRILKKRKEIIAI